MTRGRSWKVLCWNIRGINSEAKQLALRNAIKSSGCSVVCIQETKRSDFDLAFIKSFRPNFFDKFVFFPSHGLSSGIITIWNSVVFTGTTLFTESFAIGVQFTSLHSATS